MRLLFNEKAKLKHVWFLHPPVSVCACLNRQHYWPPFPHIYMCLKYLSFTILTLNIECYKIPYVSSFIVLNTNFSNWKILILWRLSSFSWYWIRVTFGWCLYPWFIWLIIDHLYTIYYEENNAGSDESLDRISLKDRLKSNINDIKIRPTIFHVFSS